MSVLIRGMEMPNKKNGAVLIIYPDGKCAFEDGKTYQAVPVPSHGRLIDGDAVVREIESFCGTHWTTMEIKRSPTIIPAEGDTDFFTAGHLHLGYAEEGET